MTNIGLPMWAQYAAAIGPSFASVVAALLVSFFSYKSWRTARGKLNFDLFEKRFSVYTQMISVVRGKSEPVYGASSQLVSHSDASIELLEFDFDEIRFLFGREVSSAYELAVADVGPGNLETLRKSIVEAETDELRAIEAVEFNESLADRLKHEDTLRKACLPYLDFSRWRG